MLLKSLKGLSSFVSNADIALDIWRTYKVKQDIAVEDIMCGVLNCSTAKFLVLAFFSTGMHSLKKERAEKIEGCKPWLPMVFGALTRVLASWIANDLTNKEMPTEDNKSG